MALKDLAGKDLNFKKLNLRKLMPLRKTLNIEVGDHLTKVCVSLSGRGSCKVLESFLFQTPENTVTDGQIFDVDTLAKELREQLNGRGLQKVKNVTFVLTSGKVAAREVMLPLVKENRIKDVVKTNAADYFPIDMTRYHVSHCLLERVEQGENAGCRVLVFAVPLQLLQPYFELAAQIGLKVRNIDFSGNSQYQALRTVGGDAVTMYADIDCSSSCITFMQGENLLLQRTFSFGGDEMVLSYMSASGKSNEDFLTALRECSSGSQFFQDSGMQTSDIADSLSRLVENIVRSTDYFNSSHWNKQVEKVVLIGPCARLAGLREMVANATGLDTSYLGDIPHACSFASSDPLTEASLYLSCIGSNLRPVDLIPPQFKSSKRLRKLGGSSEETYVKDGMIICGICLGAAVLLSGFALLRYHMAKMEKTNVESQIEKLSYTEQVYNTYVQYRAEEKSLQTLSDSIASPNDRLTDFIEELEDKMPAQILLLSASCGQENIVMNITVPDYDAAAMVLVQLRNFESIQNIEIGSITSEVDESGGKYLSFSLTCTYGTNPYLNGINPYLSEEEEEEEEQTEEEALPESQVADEEKD
jgi:type IV pilus assembly protein PilN